MALAATIVVAAGAYGVSALADSSVPLPPEWHVHDGNCCAPQHRPVGFFPTILYGDNSAASVAAYKADPARCPNATDKAFLPSGSSPAYPEGDAAGRSDSDLLRAGVCITSTKVIELRTVPVGTAGPEGWSSLTWPTEPGFITYYRVTAR